MMIIIIIVYSTIYVFRKKIKRNKWKYARIYARERKKSERRIKRKKRAAYARNKILNIIKKILFNENKKFVYINFFIWRDFKIEIV